MDTQTLVDKAASIQGLSHAKLAKLVGVTPASLSNLRTGKGELSDETYTKLAELAGIDPALVLIDKHARKAGEESRKVWERMKKYMQGATMAAVVSVTCVQVLEVKHAEAGIAYTNTNALNIDYATLETGH